MAQQLQAINLIAPGFRGLNTEDSPLGQDPSYASVLDNCVIDRYGRVAARKGLKTLTTSKLELGSEAIEAIHVFEDVDGNEVLFSAGNNKIFSGGATLVDETPSGYTITDNNWDIVNFNNHTYFFVEGHEPLVYSDSLGAVTKMSDVAGYAAPGSRTYMDGNSVLAAFGRLFVASFEDDKQTIYWSDLLQGHVWSGGSSGSIDVSEYWPDGYDEIIKVAAHNNFLVVFGRHSIIIYSGAESPASMTLSSNDSVSGVGARCRCAVKNIGGDILFVSYDGLRSFGRVIQEKSLPIGDVSKNIKSDMINLLQDETQPLRVAYSPENNFFLVTLRTAKITFCFDIRGKLENGSYRVSRWPGSSIEAMHRRDDGTLYLGSKQGISTYDGYTDGGDSYQMRYFSQNLTFGDSSKTKILKKIKPTILGGKGEQLIFKWGYDFSGSYKSTTVTLDSETIAEYNLAEFNNSTFSAGTLFTRENVNTTGNGSSVVVGMEATINGAALSLQELNIFTLIGKLV